MNNKKVVLVVGAGDATGGAIAVDALSIQSQDVAATGEEAADLFDVDIAL